MYFLFTTAKIIAYGQYTAPPTAASSATIVRITQVRESRCDKYDNTLIILCFHDELFDFDIRFDQSPYPIIDSVIY